MNEDCVIVDANIAFRCLLSNRGDLRERIGPGGYPNFFSPRFLLVELFKHKDRLAQASRSAEPELLETLYTLLSRLEFVNEKNIPMGTWIEAYRLCGSIDENDTVYVAVTLHLDGQFWTEDDKLKKVLRARGFNRFFIPDKDQRI
ncbi:MAG: PIN domain-containing protein [Limisphaerales bacterium]